MAPVRSKRLESRLWMSNSFERELLLLLLPILQSCSIVLEFVKTKGSSTEVLEEKRLCSQIDDTDPKSESEFLPKTF